MTTIEQIETDLFYLGQQIARLNNQILRMKRAEIINPSEHLKEGSDSIRIAIDNLEDIQKIQGTIEMHRCIDQLEQCEDRVHSLRKEL